jgi:hypothetical protein
VARSGCAVRPDLDRRAKRGRRLFARRNADSVRRRQGLAARPRATAAARYLAASAGRWGKIGKDSSFLASPSVIVPARRAGAPARTVFESYAANWRCCADLISFIVSFNPRRLQRKASCSGYLARWFGFTWQSILLRQQGAKSRCNRCADRGCARMLERHGGCRPRRLLWFAWQTQAARVLRAILFLRHASFGRAPPTRCAALGFKFKKSANSGDESRLRRRAMSLHGTLRT